MTLDRLRYRVLGPLEVSDRLGRPVALRGPLQRRALAGLISAAGRVATFDSLVELLWPDRWPDDPRAGLQTHLFRLRRLLGDDSIVTEPSGYRFVVDEDEVDDVVFWSLRDRATSERPADPLTAAATLDEALGLWRGAAYPDLADWDPGRLIIDRLGEARLKAIEDRADAVLAAGRADSAIAHLEELVATEPLRERPRALLMSALAASGRHVEALRSFGEFRRTLADEVGLEPSAGIRRLEQEILTADMSDTPPEHVRVSAPRSTAPVALTELIGRDALVDELVAAVPTSRLVTLVGPSGVGKTRVAARLAERLAASWWIDLTTVAADADVPAVMAASLGVDQGGHESWSEAIATSLNDRTAVLVVDNADHVLEGVVAVVSLLLGRISSLAVVVTSRERLAVAGERVCVVAPLGVEVDGAAAQLFVQRAAEIRPDLALSDRADLVAEVCRRLDGLPLALELAAAQLRSMEPEEILAALEQRFTLLTGGNRAVRRHQSLASAIAWSVKRLDGDDRAAFAAVHVFAGAFTTSAASAVTSRSEVEARALLGRLVDRSLLAHRPGSVPARFVMLESLREYAGGLVGDEEATRLRAVHADHYVELAERSHDELVGPAPRSLAAIDLDVDELRRAHHTLVAAGDVDGAVRLTTALHGFAVLRGRSEVFEWAMRAAELAEQAGDPRAATAFASAAHGAMRHRPAEMERLAQRGLQAAGSVDASEARWPVAMLGAVARVQGRIDEAIGLNDRASQLASGIGDRTLVALTGCARILTFAYGGRYKQAELEQRLLLDLLPSDRASALTAFARYAAGEAAAPVDATAAVQRFTDALDRAESSGADFVALLAQTSLTALLAGEDDVELAARHCLDLLDRWEQLGVWSNRWVMLRLVVGLLARAGQEHAAAVLQGALDERTAIWRSFGRDAEQRQQLLAELSARLGDREVRAALDEGAQLDDQALMTIARRTLALTAGP